MCVPSNIRMSCWCTLHPEGDGRLRGCSQWCMLATASRRSTTEDGKTHRCPASTIDVAAQHTQQCAYDASSSSSCYQSSHSINVCIRCKAIAYSTTLVPYNKQVMQSLQSLHDAFWSSACCQLCSQVRLQLSATVALACMHAPPESCSSLIATGPTSHECWTPCPGILQAVRVISPLRARSGT
jgi:hypothetical protein